MTLPSTMTRTRPADATTPLSFRDPAGFLVAQGERMLRTVRREYAQEICVFLQSLVAQEWVGRGALASAHGDTGQRSRMRCPFGSPSDLIPFVLVGMDSRPVDCRG